MNLFRITFIDGTQVELDTPRTLGELGAYLGCRSTFLVQRNGKQPILIQFDKVLFIEPIERATKPESEQA